MKTILLAVLFHSFLIGQIVNENIPTEFPKIGFGDMNKLFVEFDPGCPTIYEQNEYYYPLFEEAGFTHVVTPATDPPFTYQNTIKILDENMRWDDLPKDTSFYPYAYALSPGNGPATGISQELPYEVGGSDRASELSEDDNLGFGTSGPPNNARYSWWLGYVQPGELIGNQDFYDVPNDVVTAYANVDDEEIEGYLVKAKLDPSHQGEYNLREAEERVFEYKLIIKARIEGPAHGSDEVATVYIYEDPESVNEDYDYCYSYLRNYKENTAEPTYLVWHITADDFSSAGNNYKELKSEPFLKTFGRDAYLRIDILWKDTRSMYIDNFYVFNQYYEKLYIEEQGIKDYVRNRIKTDFSRLSPSYTSNPLYEHVYLDEPPQMTNRAYGEVSHLAQEYLGTGKYVNATIPKYPEHRIRVINRQRDFLGYVMMNFYPFIVGTTYESTGPNNIQDRLDILINETISFGTFDSYSGLRTHKQLAQKFDNDPSNDLPFYHTIQCMGEKLTDEGEIIWDFRPPTTNEIYAQGWLAMCYGATGIMYYNTYTITRDLSGNRFYGVWGLFDDGIHQYPEIEDECEPQVPNDRFYAVKELNQEIATLENQLVSLTWKDAFSFHKPEERNRLYSDTFISELISYKVFDGIPEIDPLSQSFVEVGVFKNTSQYTNYLLDYVMLVNRRGLVDEGRTYEVFYEKPGTPYVNWRFWDVAANEFYAGTSDDDLAIYIDPGKGKLFNLEPTVIGGGNLIYNEVISSDITLKRDLIVEDGVTLTVNADYVARGNIILKNGATLKTTTDGTITFPNGNILIVEGSVNIFGTAANNLILDFYSAQDYNGIGVSAGSYLYMDYCEIQNADYGIFSDTDVRRIDLFKVDFMDCGTYGIYHPGLITHPFNFTIEYCTFMNMQTGIFAANRPSATIKWNEFTDCETGIFLSGIGYPYVLYNTLTSLTPENVGIFLESCNGEIRGNDIFGFTNGIHLGNSSPKIGDNEISDNLYHGIYIGSGSNPNMKGELAGSPPNYYPVAGYNIIEENGGWEVISSHKDGSEIYFAPSSNAVLKQGCNSILDPRTPSGNLVTTQYLLGAQGGSIPIVVKADENYWGDPNNPYPLSTRFSNLIVYYQPYKLDHCPLPQGGGGGEEMVIYSPTGEPIDTIYSIEKDLGEFSETDLLYAQANEQFNAGEYNSTLTNYNQIVQSEDSLSKKITAYQQLLTIGKYLNSDPEYFEDLQTDYSTAAQTTEDSLYKKVLEQLSILSTVAETDYVNAIEDFDDIIQSNPNTEEAVYAEIDALTTAMLIENGDTTLNKTAAAKYLLGKNQFGNKFNELLKQNFGKNQETEEEIIPTEYLLYQNYPNPFNPVTTIKYDLPLAGDVSLVIFDILGRRIKVLVNDNQQAGSYQIQFNASSLASGVYMYQLRGENYINTKKMILLK